MMIIMMIVMMMTTRMIMIMKMPSIFLARTYKGGLVRANSIAEILEDLKILIYFRKDGGCKMKRRYE